MNDTNINQVSWPYVCSIHVASVVQMTHMLLTHGGVMRSKAMTRAQQLATYMSAVVHDHEHGGVNNDFLIKTNHPLALRYNDISILENHHLASAALLLHSPEHMFIPVSDVLTICCFVYRLLFQLWMLTCLSQGVLTYCCRKTCCTCDCLRCIPVMSVIVSSCHAHCDQCQQDLISIFIFIICLVFLKIVIGMLALKIRTWLHTLPVAAPVRVLSTEAANACTKSPGPAKCCDTAPVAELVTVLTKAAAAVIVAAPGAQQHASVKEWQHQCARLRSWACSHVK